MKLHALALTLVLAVAPAVAGDAFVFRVCFTTDREDTDVVLREVEKREDADMCVWVTTCEAAEVKVRLDPEARRTFWRSYNPERCKR